MSNFPPQIIKLLSFSGSIEEKDWRLWLGFHFCVNDVDDGIVLQMAVVNF